MKKILLFVILTLTMFARTEVVAYDTQGEEIYMILDKVKKTNEVRVTIIDGVESLTTEYVETYNPYFIKMWYNDDPITIEVYDDGKLHTTITNDFISNYIKDDNLIIDIKDSIILPFLIDTKKYPRMEARFNILGETVFTIVNQKGEKL